MQLVEVLLERKRARLLASDNPEKVAEGKAMVTPASIFEELQAHNDIKGGNDTPVVGLGEKGSAEPKKRSKSASAEPVEMENEDADENEEQEEPEQEDDSEGEMEVEHDGEGQDAFSRSVSKKRVRSRGTALSVWLPVSFPKVPEKGSFDVNRLKDSQYFFS
ncbi:hypothetical protein V491_07349 [Pseudogymnoascus sp. VKM F-3775]|nr:hypothetical protein V491_07349 [Pseudogymnoascus sp. VKM F-3775]